MDLDEPIDWRRDEDNLPAAYLLVRAPIHADATDVATQGPMCRYQQLSAIVLDARQKVQS
ncbi:Protein of unknown function (DUF2471) (plasmid) [Paraburkholderia caribensis MBA4]|uniref:Uncharacterized protein n=1 Tax=Paraburkholderia caribensis MBA4 TaxID=1323664 RepID=A0A0P0RRI3_9BURK|nr:DUF2471 family protein [Paraburkholderia caribensis]ALL71662.1 Protein of unknown function (DUF2471) [Paraburkholderia caribensis MBA4]